MTTPSVSLAEIGWDDAWQAEAGAATPRAGTVGRVVRVDRGICAVVTADGLVRASLGSGVLEAMADDTLSTPCTGDWCVLRKWCDGPMTVERVLPRRTSVVRADSSGSSRGQALVANADVVGVVAALRPEPNLGRLERLLTLAWDSGAQPVVLLTKTDLVTDAPLVADDVRSAAPEVDVVCCSAVTGEGIDAVRQLLGGNRTMALLGASGDGKSTLSNALVGTDVLTTMAIRADGKGRHTSVRR
ncbi:MAG: GTPase RsgA, partial [Nocardioidaceae bacterium]